MIVMGGIVGSGIFINSYVVARQVHTSALILFAWVLGGIIALAGAFIYAELAACRPNLNRQYAYIREAYHPAVAFVYGWALLLVTQTGGMAAVAVTFARYFLEITHAPLADWAVAVLALTALTIINCMGVRDGSTTQNVLMVIKIVALVGLVGCGLFLIGEPRASFHPVLDRPVSLNLLTAIGAAVVPVLFSYGGWQTASFMTAELRHPEEEISRGLLIGVIAVIVFYITVNFVYVRGLGADGLAATTTPATAIVRQAFGERGASLIAIAIAVSTLGFLSQGMLTAPRVYYSMAEDGLFFKAVARVSPRTRVPSVAIAMQGVFAVLIAISGRYEQILNYVVSVDFISFGLTATCLFVFRRRPQQGPVAYRVPGHPFTTLFFVAACWLVVINTVYTYPANSAIGMGIVAAGIPAYFFWSWRKRKG